MRERIGWFLGGTLAVAIVCLLGGQLNAGEKTVSGLRLPDKG